MAYTRMHERLRSDIIDAINEADIYFKCSGYQNEHDSDLSLEEWYLEDPDSVVNTILERVSDYLGEAL